MGYSTHLGILMRPGFRISRLFPTSKADRRLRTENKLWTKRHNDGLFYGTKIPPVRFNGMNELHDWSRMTRAAVPAFGKTYADRGYWPCG